MTHDAEALFDALVSSGRLSQLRRLTYRCASHRCLLLEAVDVPTFGVVVRQKRYKYSHDENLARSSAAGRQRNTEDGDRRWRGRTYFLSQSALAYPDDRPAPHLEVTCDHVLGHLLTAPAFRDDWEAGRAEVRVLPDGRRVVL